MKYLLITDIPAPWREKVYENVYRELGDQFHVAYCHTNEKRRLWKFKWGDHPKTFLGNITFKTKNTKENYLNPEIIPFLLKNRPPIIICFSLVPTIFITLFMAKLLGSKIIVFADTWLGRDRDISKLHILARKIAYGIFPDAYIGASRETLRMYSRYRPSIKPEQMFLSPLCADNDYFLDYLAQKEIEKKYDIMFSGRIVDSKNPLFLAEVAAKVKALRGTCSLMIMGDGEEKVKKELFKKLKDLEVDYYFTGFIKHAELPGYYAQAKLLLLPTAADCWGVVINEAMVSGVPVITTEMTAAAGELIKDGVNGYVLPLESDVWAEKISYLLSNPPILEKFVEEGVREVKKYNFNQAAQGILSAIRFMEKNFD
jgi:glycosyltransferase involved in cell wall biosynthesis